MTLPITIQTTRKAALAVETLRKQTIAETTELVISKALPAIAQRAVRQGYNQGRMAEQRLTAEFFGYGQGLGWSRASGAKWPGGLSGPFGATVINNWSMRQQARGVYHDSPEAKTMVNRFADTVVDSGLRLEPEPNADILGIPQDKLEEWSRMVGAAFDLYCASKKQHRAQQYNFYQAQHLLCKYAERDNDQFLRYYYSQNSNLLNPLQFEIIDPNQIRGDAWIATALLGTMPDGIDRNPDGSEKAYHVWVQTDPGKYEFTEVVVPHIGEKSGRLMMLHSYEAEYAGQGRGYSSIGEAIQEFENLTDFKSSQIKKAINQSQLWGFNKPSPNAPSSDPLEQFAHQGVGQAPVVAGAPGVGGVNQADSATIIPPTLNVTPIMEASLTVPGSLFLANLDSGEEIVPFVNTAPSIGYSEFVDNFLSYLCAMKGMPLEVLLMKFSNNYSASRACLVLFWRVACMKRQRLDDDLITPTYEMWLSGEIAAGRVSCPGWQDPRLRAAWLCHRLIGSPMPNIDPNATAKADQLYVEMGAETLDDVAYNFNGSSGRANRQKLKTQMDQLRDVGMAAWSTTGVGSPVNTEIDPSKGANGASLDPGVPAQPPAKSAPGGPNK